MSDIYINSKKYFPTAIQEFVYYDKYSKFNKDKNRREVWPETVQRTTDYLIELSKNKLDHSDYEAIYNTILHLDVAPSMRLVATAGDAARRAPESIYNCCYMPMVSTEAITELLWMSMCGVGAGYSVEQQYIDLFPVVTPMPQNSSHDNDMLFVIPDTTEGWVTALRLALDRSMQGKETTFDYTNIRPAGSILIMKGGTASGPQVLIDLLNFVRKIIFSRQGKKLRPIDVFDICTKIGDAAVSGGSRRSAQLCMFDIDDTQMLQAKTGRFWERHPHRANANVSVTINNKLSKIEIAHIMTNMFNSGTGEPGIVSKFAMENTKPVWRREMTYGGVNACSEINLQGTTLDGKFGGQVCNLSTVNVYPKDTLMTLKEKVKIATIIGTIQSMATDFVGLRSTWKEICEEERLLGVSMIGIMDNSLVQSAEVQRGLRNYAIKINRKYAQKLNINPAAAVTTIKPAGNSSVMYGTARGINARYSPQYTRRVRVNQYTPIFKVLRDSGVPLEKDLLSNNGTWVAKFFEKSPDQAITVDDLSAIDQLKNWKQAKLSWAQHNVSVTIEYQEHERDNIIDWMYANQDIVNGLAFLPRTDHIYEQAPYEAISLEQYNTEINQYPKIDFSLLPTYEKTDTTSRITECGLDSCDLF